MKIILFGSHVKGSARDESDIDILVITNIQRADRIPRIERQEETHTSKRDILLDSFIITGGCSFANISYEQFRLPLLSVSCILKLCVNETARERTLTYS